jgi:hypothetical protein
VGLAAYEGPVLFVNGEDDRIDRPAAIERDGELDDGAVVVIREAGHTVNLERPDAYSTVVREFVLDRCVGVRLQAESDSEPVLPGTDVTADTVRRLFGSSSAFTPGLDLGTLCAGLRRLDTEGQEVCSRPSHEQHGRPW